MDRERHLSREIESFVDINAIYKDQWVVVAVTRIEDNVPTAGVVISHVQDKANLDFREMHRLRQRRRGDPPKFAIFRAGILDRQPS